MINILQHVFKEMLHPVEREREICEVKKIVIDLTCLLEAVTQSKAWCDILGKRSNIFLQSSSFSLAIDVSTIKYQPEIL